jgi:hypothetical protein
MAILVIGKKWRMTTRACVPLPRCGQYLSSGNAAVVELGVRFVDRREGLARGADVPAEALW